MTKHFEIENRTLRSENKKLREEIKNHIEDYLKSGGVIAQIPIGKTSKGETE